MRGRLLLSAFLLAATVAASQSACLFQFECIYVPVSGYLACAELEPVISTDGSGEAIEIATADGFRPLGCACMHPNTAEIWDTDLFAPELEPIFDQIQEDARVACEELAIELGADPTPCDTAPIDKTTAYKGQGTTSECAFSDGDIDDDRDCPPLGVDEVSFETGTEDTDTDDGGVVIIPDLPKQP
ncbi:hypothetical protein ACNOYE_02990 [Nannocystaceae bacterium ST9]